MFNKTNMTPSAPLVICQAGCMCRYRGYNGALPGSSRRHVGHMVCHFSASLRLREAGGGGGVRQHVAVRIACTVHRHITDYINEVADDMQPTAL